ncbi:MAG: hypothetical protein Q4G04_03360 [bacterium]|nr:hypothetical protein [bacterium]
MKKLVKYVVGVLILFFVTHEPVRAIEYATSSQPDTVTDALVRVAAILGSLMFARQLPKLLSEIFGAKIEGTFGIDPRKKLGSDPLVSALIGGGAGFLGSTASNIQNAYKNRDFKQMLASPFKGIRGGVRAGRASATGEGGLNIRQNIRDAARRANDAEALARMRQAAGGLDLGRRSEYWGGQSEADARIAELKDKIKEREQLNTIDSKRKAKIERDMANARGQIDILGNKRNTLSTDRASIKNDMNSIVNMRNGLGINRSEVDQQITNLEGKLNTEMDLGKRLDLKQQIDGLKKNVATYDSYEQQYNDLSRQAAEIDNQVAEIDNEISTLDNNINSWVSRVDSLAGSIEAREDKIKEYTEEKENIEKYKEADSQFRGKDGGKK